MPIERHRATGWGVFGIKRHGLACRRESGQTFGADWACRPVSGDSPTGEKPPTTTWLNLMP